MARLFPAAIAASLALALSAQSVAAAEAPPEQAPSALKTMWGGCTKVGEPDRDRCMLQAKDNFARGECNELMNRAQRRCLLDVLDAKPPVAGAK